MAANAWRAEWNEVPTPSYLVYEELLEKNLKVLAEVAEDTGAAILLAQKCFSMYHYYPLIGRYLAGTTASGIYEARLSQEEMGRENHVFKPAYEDEEIEQLASICDHIIFNSFSQWERFGTAARLHGVSCGMRINPECSTQDHAIYDPCAPGSRLGVKIADFREDLLAGLDGLHFHTLCEQGADALEETLDAVEEKFGKYLHGMKWLNFGGGHHITRVGYDISLLKKLIRRVQEKYHVAVYLEPGEAVALNAGFLVSEVLDVQAGGNVIPATCPMSSRCPTARLSSARAKQGRRRIRTRWQGQPVWRATRLEPTRLTRRCASVTALYSAIWQSIRWSRTIRSTGCRCRISLPSLRRENGRRYAHSAMMILR